VNVIDLVLYWQLFSDVGRPQSFVNVMSVNNTLELDPVSTVSCRTLLQLCSYVNMNFGSARVNFGGAYTQDKAL